MSFRFRILCLLLTVSTFCFGQNQVELKVLDFLTGQPISSVKVYSAYSKDTLFTDQNGFAHITFEENAPLRASSLNFEKAGYYLLNPEDVFRHLNVGDTLKVFICDIETFKKRSNSLNRAVHRFSDSLAYAEKKKYWFKFYEVYKVLSSSSPQKVSPELNAIIDDFCENTSYSDFSKKIRRLGEKTIIPKKFSNGNELLEKALIAILYDIFTGNDNLIVEFEKTANFFEFPEALRSIEFFDFQKIQLGSNADRYNGTFHFDEFLKMRLNTHNQNKKIGELTVKNVIDYLNENQNLNRVFWLESQMDLAQLSCYENSYTNPQKNLEVLDEWLKWAKEYDSLVPDLRSEKLRILQIRVFTLVKLKMNEEVCNLVEDFKAKPEFKESEVRSISNYIFLLHGMILNLNEENANSFMPFLHDGLRMVQGLDSVKRDSISLSFIHRGFAIYYQYIEPNEELCLYHLTERLKGIKMVRAEDLNEIDKRDFFKAIELGKLLGKTDIVHNLFNGIVSLEKRAYQLESNSETFAALLNSASKYLELMNEGFFDDSGKELIDEVKTILFDLPKSVKVNNYLRKNFTDLYDKAMLYYQEGGVIELGKAYNSAVGLQSKIISQFRLVEEWKRLNLMYADNELYLKKYAEGLSKLAALYFEDGNVNTASLVADEAIKLIKPKSLGYLETSGIWQSLFQKVETQKAWFLFYQDHIEESIAIFQRHLKTDIDGKYRDALIKDFQLLLQVKQVHPDFSRIYLLLK